MIKAIVEIPVGSMYKYEVDKESGRLVIDRPLIQPIPYNYGYVPNTLFKDGDPLDVCIIGRYPIVALTEVKIVPIGVFVCMDQLESDDKIVAIVEGQFIAEKNLFEMLKEVRYYLETYKAGFNVLSFESENQALETINWSLENYKKSKDGSLQV